MGETPRTEILAFVKEGVTAIDGPVISDSENRAVPRTMAGVRRHEAALTRVLLERFVKRRCIKQRKAPDLKDRVVCNHTVVRDDIEGRRGQAPPRSGDFAIRYEAFMQHITVFFTFCPFPLEIKWVPGLQEAGSRDDLGGRNAVYIF